MDDVTVQIGSILLSQNENESSSSKKRRQLNIGCSLNPASRVHMALLHWIDSQAVNRSAFIRESLMLRWKNEINQ